jgi:hypothetical protein
MGGSIYKEFGCYASFNSFMNSAACSFVFITWCNEELVASFTWGFFPCSLALLVSAATFFAIVFFTSFLFWDNSNVRKFIGFCHRPFHPVSG